MATITVAYPRSDGVDFDYDYYEKVHLPLVRTNWSEAGLTSAAALRGVAAPGGGEPPFFAIALLRFQSMEALQGAMAGPNTAEIMRDIPKFTTVQPLVQINEQIGS